MQKPKTASPSYTIFRPASAAAWLSCITIALLAICLSVFYLAHDHTYLARWFLSLNRDIAHRDQWTTRFFSPATKSAGNYYSLMALAAGSLVITMAVRALRYQRHRKERRPGLSRADVPAYLLLLAGAAGLWYWGQRLAEPGADEFYSAYYCAGAHPFQTLAYYMDPNNHVLYNLLNRLLFFFAEDKVLTGRLLSLAAYGTMLCLLYRWLKAVTGSGLAALFMTLALGTQFQVLGFAQLARGYELDLLLHWLACITFFRYLSDGSADRLPSLALTHAAGFLTLPTYLYFFITLQLTAAIYQAYCRRPDLRYWKSALLAGVLAFLLYIPALLFSGLPAITANEFVSGRGGLDAAYCAGRLRSIIQECFWINYPARQWGYGLLLLIPLPALFVDKHPERRAWWVCYALAWPVYFCIVLQMQRFASMRNLLWQYHCSLLAILLAFFYAFRWAAARIRKPAAALGGTLVLSTTLVLHFLIFFPWQIDTALYGISTGRHNQGINAVVRSMPAGTTFACPDFAIAWYYLARGSSYPATVHPTGREAVLVLHDADTPLGTVIPGYRYWKTESYYFIYIRNDLHF